VATPRYYWLLPSRDAYEERGIGSEPKIAVSLFILSPSFGVMDSRSKELEVAWMRLVGQL
jgi:hypothetical protein